MATEESNINCYLTEELVIQILLRLPMASCLARLRCVCKSWCAILSDPKFIRDLTFFRNSSDLRLMIKRLRHDRSVYSLHSYDTLRLLASTFEEEEEEDDVPSLPYKVRWPNGTSNLSIVGCCNGIFCLADGNSDGASDIILWNPETSETKVLPVSPFAHLRGFVVWGQLEKIGFGFDPVTNDFKVVRTLQFSPADDDDDDYDDDRNYSEEEEEDTTMSEVYSLRNDSWRKLEGGFAHSLLYSIPDCQDGRFYWWDDGQEEGYTDFVFFDMKSEVFETIQVPNPAEISSKFAIRSVSMVKGSAVAIFSDIETVEVANSMEIWMAMKLGGAWTKLWSIGSNLGMKCVHPVGMWRNGECFLQRYDNGELVVFNPETGDIRELKIQGEWQFFQLVPYAPSQIRLLDFS